jgi:Protein of unknown function (DUF2778)
MQWTFEITTGKMYSPTGELAGMGYAGGDLGARPEAIDNPAFENVPNVGPLPEGFYSFGPWIDRHPKLGIDVFELLPDLSNKMFGRSSFFIHGDTAVPRCASEGCIVMPNPVRHAMYNSGCHRLQVVAVYQKG